MVEPIRGLIRGVQSNLIGCISEHAVALDLLKRGFNVLMPAVVSRYDLLVEVNDRYLKVQVKTARVDHRDGNLRVTWERPYYPNEVDLIAVHDPASSRIFYVPIGDIPVGSKGITIRVTRYKQNKKTTGLKAEHYMDFPLERMIAAV